MAEAALDHLKRHASLAEHVASRMAEAVEGETFEASTAQRRVVDTLAEAGGSNRPAVGRLEDKIAGIGPASASEVGAQLVEETIGDRDGPPGGDGLASAFDKTAFDFVERGSHRQSAPEETDGADKWADDLGTMRRPENAGPGGFVSVAEAEAFAERGVDLSRRLGEKLGDGWHVMYMPVPTRLPHRNGTRRDRDSLS